MRVKDLSESIEFYRKNFGFTVKEDQSNSEEPWVIIGLPGVAYLCLYEHPAKQKPEGALTINHFGFVVPDFDNTLETLKARGVEILYGGPVEWSHSRSIYIKDPSGHEIELSEKVGGGLEEK